MIFCHFCYKSCCWFFATIWFIGRCWRIKVPFLSIFSIFLWYNFVWFDFWDKLTIVLKVLKNKGVIFSLFKKNYLLSFLLQKLLLISFCFSSILFVFFLKEMIFCHFCYKGCCWFFATIWYVGRCWWIKVPFLSIFSRFFLSNFLWYDFVLFDLSQIFHVN